jgi:outer membrane protein W
MKTIKRKLFLILLLTTISFVSIAQNLSLKGRSALELNLGFWRGEKTQEGLVVPSYGTTLLVAEINNFTGGLGYSYWLKEHLSLTLTVSLLSAKTNTTITIPNVTQEVSTVIPLLLGIRFYFPVPDSSDNIRPYFSFAMGPYFGSESANTILSYQAHTETAVGWRFGAGIDFFLGNHFKLGISAGYHQFFTDFEKSIGARKNYNGTEFSLGAGYIF